LINWLINYLYAYSSIIYTNKGDLLRLDTPS